MNSNLSSRQVIHDRMDYFDFLRALAVLLVVGHHAAWRFPPLDNDLMGMVFLRVGWIGVDIFFVISGFMITRVLLQSSYGTSEFFRRRAFRILPIFFVAVFTFYFASLITGMNDNILHRMWSPLLLLNGWTIPFFGYEGVPYTITWSLSVEESAYIALGLSAIYGAPGIFRMLVIFLLVAIFTRFVVVFSGVIDSYDLYFFVLARLDSIALGGFAAFGIFNKLMASRSLTYFTGFAMVLLILIFQFISLNNAIMPLLGYFIFALFASLFVAGLSQVKYIKPLIINNKNYNIWALIRGIFLEFGRLSYFIYLFHLFILEGVRFVAPSIGFWWALIFSLVITFYSARLSWKYFEAPMIARGRLSSWREALGFSRPLNSKESN